MDVHVRNEEACVTGDRAHGDQPTTNKKRQGKSNGQGERERES